MDQVQVTISVLVAASVLVGFLAALWRSADRTVLKTSNETLRASNADLLARLNFVEPQLAAALESNKVLQDLHNPRQQLDAIDQKQTQTIALLESQGRVLRRVAARVHVEMHEDDRERD